MALAFGGRSVGDLSIDYTVDVDPRTGAASLRVPVPAPPGRHGLAPALTLAYTSGAGNSAFGAGWSLGGLPVISLDTRLHVPRWDGTDGYQLGGDELVPWLEHKAGGWTPRGFVDGEWSVAFLRSRRGSTPVRVEKWLHVPSGRIHFRTRDARNVLTIYGARPGAAARIADPDDETRTFAWLPELQIDPSGNALWFDYAPETLDGVDLRAPFERSRRSQAQRYLERIRYGNVSPLQLDDSLLSGTLPEGVRWCFQLVVDYGQITDPEVPIAPSPPSWPARQDPFSTFRNGFEVRTYRLCRRFLAYHDFDELGSGPTLVGALVLAYDEAPTGSTLREIAYTGYRRDGGVVTSKSIPTLRMTYATAATDAAFTEVPAQAQENLPAGLQGRRLAFVDLYGEGLAGMLTESDRAWYYKPNLGGGAFGAQTMVLERPATRPGTFGFGDIDRDGDTDLSQLAGRLAGLYELDREERVWRAFRPFAELPHVEALGGRAQWVDLNGDGRADIVVVKEDALVWFASEGEGFRPPVQVPRPAGAPPATAADPALDFFFADMTGDGLSDLVRVQNGRVEYWPSLGNGHFGSVVIMDGAPQFAPDDEFDAGRLRFVDLDGSGTTDIVYLGRGEVTCFLNAAGNQLVPGPRITGLPYLDKVSSVQVLDFLGDGRACIVWSSPLPGRESPLEYLPLTPAVPPRLLVSVDNSLGRRTSLSYSSSSTHYLRDVASGRDWSTKLPAHRPVVDRREVLDQIANTRSVVRYAYHDGYYDGAERESRGFGQVDIYDAEAVDGTAPGPGAAAFTAPSLVRTWFHLGTEMRGRHRPMDTYAGDPNLPWLAPHVVDDTIDLTAEEIEDGLRALAGQTIRREVYAVGPNDVPAPHPFEVMQASFRLRSLQPARGGAKAAFSVVSLEDATWAYEQTPGDPRVAHHVVVSTDSYDSPVRTATIGYARRAGRARDVAAQGRCWLRIDDHRVINVDEPLRYELGVPFEGKSCELAGIRPGATGLFTRADFQSAPVTAALMAPGPHEVDLSDDPTFGPAARLLSWDQSFYWDDARAGALPLGQVGALTMVHHEESACFTEAFLADALGGRAVDSDLAPLGYVQRDGLFWQVDATHEYTSAAKFSVRSAVVRGDGATTTFTYDAYAIALTAVTDPLDNNTSALIDYHQVTPTRLTDPNGNVSEVRYDPLGVVVATTRFGHVGNQPWGFDPLAAVNTPAPSTLADVLAAPASCLQGAESYVWYDLGAWFHDGVPTHVIRVNAEQLLHDGAGGGSPGVRIQIGITYLDGLGRVLQEKALVEPGPAIQRDAQGEVVVDAGGSPVLADSTTRWRVSSHIVYDTKEHPGRRYEPFFSPSPAYEGDDVLRHIGVSLVSHYDAIGRSVGEDFPNGTFTTTIFGSWTVEEADPNDNVTGSAYGALREGLPADDPERAAYLEALPHAGTTRLTYLDPLGRDTGNLARGGSTAPDRRTETVLDIDGAVRRITDPRGLAAFAYRRDMRGQCFHEVSVDAGEAWSLPDAHDRVATTWDARGFRVDHGYDLGDRPLHTHVIGGDGATSLDHHVEQWVYGESLPNRTDAVQRNLLGRAVTIRDSAGEITVDHCDPTGRAMSATRRLRTYVDPGPAPVPEPDWRTSVSLEADAYTTVVVFDALGRATSDTLPDGTTRTYEYLPSGPLSRVLVTTPDGSLTSTPVLAGTAFGARGERLRLSLGNGVQVAYGYDPQSNRLATKTASLGGKKLQAVRLTWDPTGNLVRLVDDAQQGSNPLIRGATASARRDYAYDAHYRLRSATGRVHKALLQNDYVPSAPGAFMGSRRLALNDGTAIEQFTQTYGYDAAGSLLYTKHVGQSRSWNSEMWVSPTSNRSLPAFDLNGVPVASPESKFDAAGNLVQVAHLRRMEWTYSGSLARGVVTERPFGTDDAERYMYGGDGLRVRKVTTRVVNGGKIEVTEKIYLGDSERKRITRDGKLILDRWTTHVSDGEHRVALIYRWLKDDLAREVDEIATPRIDYQLDTHQGSAALVLDAVGKIVSYEEFFPYGGTAFIAGDDVREVSRKEYRYSGKECDDFTGLYDYGQRYYAPWMGRWLSPDPIGPEDDLNLYQFVRGEPVGNVDPTGLETQALGTVQAKNREEALRAINRSDWMMSHLRRATDVERRGDTWVVTQDEPIFGSLTPGDPNSAPGGKGGTWAPDPGKSDIPWNDGSPAALDLSQPASGGGAAVSGGGSGTGAESPGQQSGDDKTAGPGGAGARGQRTGARGAKAGDGTGLSDEGNGFGVGVGPGRGTGVGNGTDLRSGKTPGSGKGEHPGGGAGHGTGKGKEHGTGHGKKGSGVGDGKGDLDGGTGHGTFGTGRRTTDDQRAGDSGTGTPTGGTVDPKLTSGVPAPPGATPGAGEPEGTHGGSADRRPPGDASGGKRAGEGTSGGGHRGTVLDEITRVAGYANLEFGDDREKGQSGGVPGGHGSHNMGAIGQLAYIVVAIVGIVGPGKAASALKLGGRLLLRLGARALAREGVQLGMRAIAREGTHLLANAGAAAVGAVGRLLGRRGLVRAPTLSALRTLRQMGMSRLERRAFYAGETVVYNMPSKGGSIIAVARLEKDRVASAIFSIKNPDNVMGAVRDFREFGRLSEQLARAAGVRELELGGVAVMNPKVEQFLLRQGFEAAKVPIPEALGGGGMVDIFRRVIEIVR
jgi:RHS repeat-associated protein